MNQPQPDTHEVEDGSLDAEVNQRLVKTLEDSAAAPGSLCLRPTSSHGFGVSSSIAMRLATLAIVPVNNVCVAVKPLSNGEPCAKADSGMQMAAARKQTFGMDVSRVKRLLEDGLETFKNSNIWDLLRLTSFSLTLA